MSRLCSQPPPESPEALSGQDVAAALQRLQATEDLLEVPLALQQLQEDPLLLLLLRLTVAQLLEIPQLLLADEEEPI